MLFVRCYTRSSFNSRLGYIAAWFWMLHSTACTVLSEIIRKLFELMNHPSWIQVCFERVFTIVSDRSQFGFGLAFTFKYSFWLRSIADRFRFALKKFSCAFAISVLTRAGSRMRAGPGTLVFASHLHPHPYPEVRVCATNIFIGSDIVAATIFCFVNGQFRNLISHHAFENLGINIYVRPKPCGAVPKNMGP